ncbi:MAG: ABC transporter ATP-binding protein [Chloroflexota bacterium]
MPNPLEIHNLTKSYNGVQVLSGVSLSVRPGQITALLGPSGCGKTTTLRLIAGFEWPDSGTIAINGRIVASDTVRVPAEERRVGMVFQEYALFPHLSVADNITFGLSGKAKEKAERAKAMLALVGLSGIGNRMPYELSGGQQQRVALARALAPQPDILLLDEPFSNLDAALRGQVRSEVRAILKQTNITCVFVTHDQEEALSLADEVAIMLQGRVAQVAPPQKLYHRPATAEIAAFVGEANFVPGEAEGSHVVCAFGSLPLDETRHGPVQVLIRPEAIRLDADGSGGTVMWREFYGHDQRIGLLLDSGISLVARADAAQVVDVGQTVGVAINGPVRAFPA